MTPMLTEQKLVELIRAVEGLPPEGIDQVCNFALFLKARRCGTHAGLDDSCTWTDEELADLSKAVVENVERRTP
jgi:hypothetical protein